MRLTQRIVESNILSRKTNAKDWTHIIYISINKAAIFKKKNLKEQRQLSTTTTHIIKAINSSQCTASGISEAQEYGKEVMTYLTFLLKIQSRKSL